MKANPEPKKYCWSEDGENFRDEFETREQASNAAAWDYDCDSWSTGVIVPASLVISTDSIIELISRHTLETVADNDRYECLDNVTREHHQELESLIRAWADRHDLNPRFFKVEEIEEHDLESWEESLTPEEMAAWKAEQAKTNNG